MSLTGTEFQLPLLGFIGGKEDDSFEPIARRIPMVRILLHLGTNARAPFREEEGHIAEEDAGPRLGRRAAAQPTLLLQRGKVTEFSPCGAPLRSDICRIDFLGVW